MIVHYISTAQKYSSQGYGFKLLLGLRVLSYYKQTRLRLPRVAHVSVCLCVCLLEVLRLNAPKATITRERAMVAGISASDSMNYSCGYEEGNNHNCNTKLWVSSLELRVTSANIIEKFDSKIIVH